MSTRTADAQSARALGVEIGKKRLFESVVCIGIVDIDGVDEPLPSES